MSKVLVLITITLALLSAQTPDFNPLQLTPKGRAAYDHLFSACVFRIGGVGYAGVTSTEESALYDLLEEEHAVEAPKSLVTSGSYEGGLYGLLGLSLKDVGEFNRAVAIYEARKDARLAQPSRMVECGLSDTEEYVGTQWGCLLGKELRTKVVTAIQSGRYDRLLQPKYRPDR